ASIDLVRVLLKDAAYLEQADVDRENRKRSRRGEKHVKPLFDIADVEAVMALMRPLAFATPDSVIPGVMATLLPAGHILGAASVVLDISEAGRRKRIVFSGDLGPGGTTLLQDPKPPDSADLVLLESTYGDRNHRPRDAT